MGSSHRIGVHDKADVVVDLQYGSTGKGLICGYLARTGVYDTVIAANMPNAGHTFIEGDRKWVHKALPSGIFVKKNVMIGPGSVFDPERLAKEIHESEDFLKNKKIYIHESAGVLQPHHRETEQRTLSKISSTMQGSAACLVDKIMRKEGAIAADCQKLLEQFGLDRYVLAQEEWIEVIHSSHRILVEGSQGYSLGISAGFYPYCTSRECTAARVMADCGVPPGFLHKVIGSARCHPIRVGNTSDGHSGGYYSDQEEITWESLGVVPERTTVTNRIRRVFTFSKNQIVEAMLSNCVDEVFLNFANYDLEYAKKVMDIINSVADEYELGGVAYVGVGSDRTNVLNKRAFDRLLVEFKNGQ